jgi:hypothetical protein
MQLPVRFYPPAGESETEHGRSWGDGEESWARPLYKYVFGGTSMPSPAWFCGRTMQYTLYFFTLSSERLLGSLV